MNAVRDAIHRTPNCLHKSHPLYRLRLAITQRRVTGNGDEVKKEVNRLRAAELSELDQLMVELYAITNELYQNPSIIREVSTHYDAMLPRMAQLSAANDALVPELVSELLAHQVGVWVNTNYRQVAEGLLRQFYARLNEWFGAGTLPAHRVAYLLARAHFAYRFESARAAAAYLLEAQKIELSPESSPCYKEVLVMRLALMYAAAGEYERAQSVVEAWGLPYEEVDVFWNRGRPDGLTTALRFYGYIASK